MIKSVILAAGEGTRMKSNHPKVLHKVCGQPMVEIVLDAAREAGCEKNIVIVGHSKEAVIETIDGKDVAFAEQPIGKDMPYGTGYAVMQAQTSIDDEDQVVILCGDTPLITGTTLKEMVRFHQTGSYKATVLTAIFNDPTGYGRIMRDDSNHVIGIVEHKDTDEAQRHIKEINSGIYCFEGKVLKEVLGQLDNNNSQNEYYLTDALEILSKEGHKVGGFTLEDNTEIMGVNSRIQLSQAENMMRKRINESLMVEGVTFIDADKTYIHKKVKIGRDTILYPGVMLEGQTEVGEGCIIGHNTRIENSTIKDKVSIQSSTIIDSFVDEAATVGPYAYLRPNSRIGKSVKIGDFVEVKNAAIGDGSKASHLAYIGDAEIGEQVNIGCGVVFVNYDGTNKHKTIVEDGAFVGSNSNLVAPVTIKEKGYVAAGSTIINEVGQGDLAIARARQVNKPGWVEKNKSKK